MEPQLVYNPHHDDEIDLLELFDRLLQQWKLILSITLLSALAGLVYVLNQPNEYQVDAKVSLPSPAHVERFVTESLIAMEDPGQELFTRYYRFVRANRNLRAFTLAHDQLSLLYPNMGSLTDRNRLLAELADAFSVTIAEPQAGRNETATAPTLLRIALNTTQEQAGIEFISGYMKYANATLMQNFQQQMESIRSERLRDLNRQITLLREGAETEREMAIARKQEENELALAKLVLERDLLVQLAGRNRVTQLAEIAEAKQIAEQLGLREPTPLDKLANKEQDMASMVPLSTNQDVPLALMGTRYLKTLEETLKARNEDEIFFRSINDIDKEIQAIKADPVLQALQARTNDDPYIEELPALLTKIDKLKSKNFNFNDIELYTAEQLANPGDNRVGPRRALIMALCIVIGGMAALFIALIRGAISHRRKEVEENTPKKLQR